MKQISIALLLCLCTLAGFAQSGKALDLKEIVSGKFTPKNISGVIPIPGDGEHYSQMNADRTQIIKYSFKTGKPVEVLFDAATARECTFKTFDSYSFAPDGSKLLDCHRNNSHLPPFLYGCALHLQPEAQSGR